MHLDVIGMAIPAMGVVHHQHVHHLGVQQVVQTVRRLVHVGLPEAVGMGVGRVLDHAAVPVTQKGHAGHAQHLG